jgi:hypothetical protein
LSAIPAQTGITAYWLDNAGDYALIFDCVNASLINRFTHLLPPNSRNFAFCSGVALIVISSVAGLSLVGRCAGRFGSVM